MATIVGISGSLRKHSFNTALLRVLAALAPKGSELRIESIAGIPLYNADDEAATGVPDTVAHLKDAIAGTDGLLIATPEYNNSIPGVTKNAIDWLSRPPADIARVFHSRPVAIAGASPGGFGTVLSQNAWLTVMRTLGVDLWSGRLLVSRASTVFDEDDKLIDGSLRDKARAFIEGFVGFVEARQASATKKSRGNG